METGKGKCPFEPSQHYTAVMAGGAQPGRLTRVECSASFSLPSFLTLFFYLDGTLYTAATSNFLGTLFDISRASGPEQERIRTERSINWLNGEICLFSFTFFCFVCLFVLAD